MSSTTQLETILSTSKKEQWPYPKTFQALKEAGVSSYEVKIADFDATYIGSFGSLKESAPEGFTPLAISPKLNEQALIDTLERYRRKEIDYIGFLTEAAKAGVAYYEVSMTENIVTYFGVNKIDYYSEKVPLVASS